MNFQRFITVYLGFYLAAFVILVSLRPPSVIRYIRDMTGVSEKNISDLPLLVPKISSSKSSQPPTPSSPDAAARTIKRRIQQRRNQNNDDEDVDVDVNEENEVQSKRYGQNEDTDSSSS